MILNEFELARDACAYRVKCGCGCHITSVFSWGFLYSGVPRSLRCLVGVFCIWSYEVSH